MQWKFVKSVHFTKLNRFNNFIPDVRVYITTAEVTSVVHNYEG
ncbi:MAG: hypothetical protein ACYC7D_13715 [Nitrososphaerales archaeon]